MVIDPSGSPRARAIAAANGAELCEKAPVGRPSVAHAFGPVEALPALLGRWWWRRVPVVWTPTTPPGPLPWWNRRVARLVFSSQDEARAWAAHVPLGRTCACEDPASMEAVYREVASMSRRSRANSGPDAPPAKFHRPPA